MRAVDIIAKKRDGGLLKAGEIEFMVKGFVSGDVPDYQMAAWAMAVLLRGMTPQETTDLTMSMVRSGETLNLRGIAPVIVDKHSTGGVGDKTTLLVAPLVAAVGLPVAKMSGRGLGFTGGTLDKLEAIPGMSVSLGIAQFMENVRKHGIVVSGQTADLAPADGQLYALRDVTATVPSLPLIASSIMSKKIAGGADAVVLDVKVGQGAFMATLEDATELADAMIQIGRGVGKRVTAVLSDMSQPLGRTVGNALEVREAVETLRSDASGPKDLLEHCLVIASEMLVLGQVVSSPEEGRARCLEALANGRALLKFVEWVIAQGGDGRIVDDLARLPQAQYQQPVVAPKSGYLAGIDARKVGLSAVALGAGRQRKGDTVDMAVGVVLHAKIGDWVDEGQPLFTIHTSRPVTSEIRDQLLAAYTWSNQPTALPALIYNILRSA